VSVGKKTLDEDRSNNERPNFLLKRILTHRKAVKWKRPDIDFFHRPLTNCPECLSEAVSDFTSSLVILNCMGSEADYISYSNSFHGVQ
jgi:hypothetical protein